VGTWCKGRTVDHSEKVILVFDQRKLSLGRFLIKPNLVLFNLVAMNKSELITDFFGTPFLVHPRHATVFQAGLSHLGQAPTRAGEKDQGFNDLLRRVFLLLLSFGLRRKKSRAS